MIGQNAKRNLSRKVMSTIIILLLDFVLIHLIQKLK